MQNMESYLERIAISLERIANSMEEATGGEVKSSPPKFYANVESFATYDWEAIAAKPLAHDEDGFVSEVCFQGKYYKRRNKQGDIWFSRKIGKNAEGNPCYDTLIRFDSEVSPVTELPRNVRKQFQQPQQRQPQQPDPAIAPKQYQNQQTQPKPAAPQRSQQVQSKTPAPKQYQQAQPKPAAPEQSQRVQPQQPQKTNPAIASKQPGKPALYPQHNTMIKEAREISGMDVGTLIAIMDAHFDGLRPDQMHVGLINRLLRHIAIVRYQEKYQNINVCASSYDGRINLDMGGNYELSHFNVFKFWCEEARRLPELSINPNIQKVKK